jgi:hypothetical protein
MVSTKDGIMLCDDCGGTCPAGTDNYDDVMHEPGCSRRKALDIWVNHPTIQRLAHDGMLCRRYRRSIMELTSAPFARACPAHALLFDVLPDEVYEWISSMSCAECDSCYEEYYEPHEEELLNMADEWSS